MTRILIVNLKKLMGGSRVYMLVSVIEQSVNLCGI